MTWHPCAFSPCVSSLAARIRVAILNSIFHVMSTELRIGCRNAGAYGNGLSYVVNDILASRLCRRAIAVLVSQSHCAHMGIAFRDAQLLK